MKKKSEFGFDCNLQLLQRLSVINNLGMASSTIIGLQMIATAVAVFCLLPTIGAFRFPNGQSRIQRLQLKLQMKMEAPPRHVAFIVDGNGRWAEQRGLARQKGHMQGANKTVEIAKQTFKAGVEVATFYLFSTENWGRPVAEVNNIMELLEKYLIDVSTYLIENKIRLVIVGQLHRLPKTCQELIKRLSLETSKSIDEKNGKDNGNPTSTPNPKTLCLALSYGGRDEIVNAVREASEQVKNGVLCIEDVTEELFSSQFLQTGKLRVPDPDLIVRTSGEGRLSNFLLWQAAYAELQFIDCLWPDFTQEHLEQCFSSYTKKERRYGVGVGVKP